MKRYTTFRKALRLPGPKVIKSDPEPDSWFGFKVITQADLPDGFGMLTGPGPEPVFVINIGKSE